MAKFTHAPFAGGQCDSCHAPAKDGKVVLTAATAKEVCLTCHSDKGELIEKSKVQHPGAAGDCTDCHSPHASSQPGLPKTNGVDICLTCHADQAEQGKKAHIHQPAFVQGCSTCHQPHGGENLHLLRAKAPNALCLECHGPDADPAPVKDEPLVSIFGGTVKLPDTYFRMVPVLPIKYGRGHPIERHPISDIMDPSDTTKVSKPLSCASCHQPHSSAKPGLLINDESNNSDFCAQCHKGSLGSTQAQTPGMQGTPPQPNPKH
jgi:predicted CXXCH cytochrome family protein